MQLRGTGTLKRERNGTKKPAVRHLGVNCKNLPAKSLRDFRGSLQVLPLRDVFDEITAQLCFFSSSYVINVFSGFPRIILTSSHLAS